MRTSTWQSRVYDASSQWVILGLVLLLTGLLGGCAFLQAVSFQRHELSLVPPDEVTVELLSKKVGERSSGTDAEKKCGYGATGPSSIRPETKILGPIAAAAIVAGATWTLNIVGDELAAYLDKKQKEFKRTFQAQVHTDWFLKKAGDGYDLAFDCIVLSQKTRDKEAGFDFAARFLPARDTTGTKTALRIVPSYYSLTRSTASTAKDIARVDVTVQIIVDAVATSEKDKSLITIADRTVSLLGVELPDPPQGETDAVSPKIVEAKDLYAEKASSTWFGVPSAAIDQDRCKKDTSCKGILPASVTVIVTETGTGSPDYGTASKEVGDTTKALSDGISKIIDAYEKEHAKK